MALHPVGTIGHTCAGAYCSRTGAVRWIALIVAVAVTSVSGHWWLLPLVPAAALLPLELEWAIALIVVGNAALIYANTYRDIAPALAASCLAASCALRLHGCRRTQLVIAATLVASLFVRALGAAAAPYVVTAMQAVAVAAPVPTAPSTRFRVYSRSAVVIMIQLVPPN